MPKQSRRTLMMFSFPPGTQRRNEIVNSLGKMGYFTPKPSRRTLMIIFSPPKSTGQRRGTKLGPEKEIEESGNCPLQDQSFMGLERCNE